MIDPHGRSGRWIKRAWTMLASWLRFCTPRQDLGSDPSGPTPAPSAGFENGWRRATLILFMAACLFTGIAAHAAERTPFQVRCEDTIKKTVTVLSSQQHGYTIDTHLSARTLTVMKDVAPANVYAAGLTKTESRVDIALGGPILQDPATSYECIAPQIDVRLYYVPVVIYIAKELPPDSCAYKEVLAHEMRHLQAYIDHLPKVDKLVREALTKRFGDKPLYAPSGTAMSALEHEINTGWLPYINAELAKVEEQQALIDAPEEYARIGKACGGEIAAILGKLRPAVPARRP